MSTYKAWWNSSLSILLVSQEQVSPESFVGMLALLKNAVDTWIHEVCLWPLWACERTLLAGRREEKGSWCTQPLHCPKRRGRRGNLISGSRSSSWRVSELPKLVKHVSGTHLWWTSNFPAYLGFRILTEKGCTTSAHVHILYYASQITTVEIYSLLQIHSEACFFVPKDLKFEITQKCFFDVEIDDNKMGRIACSPEPFAADCCPSWQAPLAYAIQ